MKTSIAYYSLGVHDRSFVRGIPTKDAKNLWIGSVSSEAQTRLNSGSERPIYRFILFLTAT